MKESQNREEHIDIFRGFGIILMIMGHIKFGKRFDYFIHAFHMPMFFFISGMFFRMRPGLNFMGFIRKKAKTLLLPYAVFGVFHYAVWLMLNWPKKNIYLLNNLLFVNTNKLPIAGALWFLTALFFAELIYYMIRRYAPGTVLQSVLAAAVALLGCYAVRIFPSRLPYALDAAFVGVGLMQIGWLVSSHMEKLSRLFRLKYLEWILFAGVTCWLIFKNGYINMRDGSYAMVPLFWLNAVLSVIVGLNLSKYFARLGGKCVINRELAYIGRNSIVYLCLNQLAIFLVKEYIPLQPGSSLISKIIQLLLVLAGLHMISAILLNTRLKVILGK